MGEIDINNCFREEFGSLRFSKQEYKAELHLLTEIDIGVKKNVILYMKDSSLVLLIVLHLLSLIGTVASLKTFKGKVC